MGKYINREIVEAACKALAAELSEHVKEIEDNFFEAVEDKGPKAKYTINCRIVFLPGVDGKVQGEVKARLKGRDIDILGSFGAVQQELPV